jgi:EF hand
MIKQPRKSKLSLNQLISTKAKILIITVFFIFWLIKNVLVNYIEFLASTLEKKYALKEEKLNSIFKQFDLDGSGKISAEELKKILGGKYKNYFKN